VHRSLPRRTPARASALLVTAALLCFGALAPRVAADDPAPGGGDLRGEKAQVEGRIEGVHDDLEESSAQVRRAAARLRSAQGRLSAARSHLAETRGKLAAAQAFDARMATRLAAARIRLERARAQLAESRRKLAEEQDDLSRIVVSSYQTGDPSLMGLSLVLTGQDPTELSAQLSSVQSVIDKEALLLDRLEASRALLTVQEAAVRKARRQVARRRAAAADNLARTQRLESQAEAAETAVQSLVDSRAGARAEARRARRADLAQLRTLEAERDRIAAVLKRRADRARARAAAAARAAGRPVPLAGGPVHSDGYLDYPVSGSVTSPFGWRTHPIFGYRSLHDGIDFGAGCGTPIRAVADGTVIEEYFQTAWGNRVIIDHGFRNGVGLATISNHLSSYAVGTGTRVRRGDVIGYVGTTGWSTGCHLHFTVLQNGTPVDPQSWF
jgi:murein DD-endopeptidase MepM/ murein hydrolase activator NlpD